MFYLLHPLCFDCANLKLIESEACENLKNLLVQNILIFSNLNHIIVRPSLVEKVYDIRVLFCSLTFLFKTEIYVSF